MPIDALREAVIKCFAHARYDGNVQHEIDIFADRIVITNPGSFANEFNPEDFAKRDIHSFLRNEVIARVLYLCKDVETFGSGIRIMYNLCKENNIAISYINSDTDFVLSFSRQNRNIMPNDGVINGTISDGESEVLKILRNDRSTTIAQLAEISNKSVRTINRIISLLKTKNLIERIGSNKKGYWEVK